MTSSGRTRIEFQVPVPRFPSSRLRPLSTTRWPGTTTAGSTTTTTEGGRGRTTGGAELVRQGGRTMSGLPPLTSLPNQQRTLNKLPTELRCRSFVNKHQLSTQIGAKRAKKTCMLCVHIPTELPLLHATVGGWEDHA